MSEDKIFSKIRNTKYIYVILIIGVAFMLFASLPQREKTDMPELSSPESSEEDRLSAILSQIEGAGRVSVMITYYTLKIRLSVNG